MTNFNTYEELLTKLKVHCILEGPFHSWDVPDDPDYEGDFYFAECKVELPDGSISNEELRFPLFSDFYEMKAHLDKYIEPYEIEMFYFEYEE